MNHRLFCVCQVRNVEGNMCTDKSTRYFGDLWAKNSCREYEPRLLLPDQYLQDYTHVPVTRATELSFSRHGWGPCKSEQYTILRVSRK